jgi:hypothetical protein
MVVALIPHPYVSRRMEMVVALSPHPFVSRHICNGSCSNSTYITGCDVRAMVVCCHSSPSYSFTFPHQMLHTRSHWLVAQMFIGLKAMIYIYIYISPSSLPQRKGKKGTFFSPIFPNFQLEEGTPLCCFTSSCPSPQISKTKSNTVILKNQIPVWH